MRKRTIGSSSCAFGVVWLSELSFRNIVLVDDISVFDELLGAIEDIFMIVEFIAYNHCAVCVVVQVVMDSNTIQSRI